MTDPYALTAGRDFDVTARNILCRADRHGAKVHEVSLPNNVTVRVLAHSYQDAEDAAELYALERCLIDEQDL